MPNIKTLPDNVLEALRNRGLDDEDIAELTPQQAFDEFCRWHGLSDWGNELWSVMDKLKSDALVQLAKRVAGLNESAGEIGAGKLAQLVQQANSALVEHGTEQAQA